MSSRPQNVGIKAIQTYIPSQFLEQTDLEAATGAPAGKITIGLGQTRMGFVNDREDIYSMALTVCSQLIKNYSIDTNSIGRLEVGTETLLDKSKSVKTVLMQLFGDNHDIEGVDTINACYGGTNAVFNAINWVESSSWDGRNAIVVCGDIAIYAEGAARPTGGAGVVAMLIGPDAPLVFDAPRGLYMEHAYDFFKPDFTSEYPVVDGHYSLTCYTKALDQAYQTYNRKAKNENGLDYFDYSVFHVPTCKLVTKCYARMLYNDFRANPEKFADMEIPAEVKDVEYTASLTDRNIEKTFLGLTKERSKTYMQPSLTAATNVGNIYTGSVWLSLASLLTFVPTADLNNKRVSLFSYGSGLASALFSLKVVGDISTIVEKIDLKHQLDSRDRVTFEEYEAALALREKAHLKKNFKPEGSIEHIRSGSYYLTEIDDMFRRQYAIKE